MREVSPIADVLEGAAMKSVTIGLLIFLLPAFVSAQEAKDESKIKPDVKALEKRFEVVKGRFDADKRRYVWVLKAKETSEEPCHFDASFQDADDKVKSVKIEFDDGGSRTMKGEKYTAYIKYPTRKTMEKVTQIVVTKSD
jgi:hypothetical protein